MSHDAHPIRSIPNSTPIHVHVRVAALAALALVATPSWARAQPEDARVHATRAEAAYALNEFADAAREYELAFKLKPQPALLFNAAQAHRLAGNQERARALYLSYLKVYGARISNRAEVDEIIRKLDAAAAVRKVAGEGPPLDTVPVASPPPAETGAPSPRAVVSSTVAPPPAPARPVPVEAAPPVKTVAASSPPAAVLVAPAPVPLARRPALWAGLTAGAVAIAAGVTAGVVVGTTHHGPTAREQIVFDQSLALGAR